ncbi:RusA family crossover junction endodeoxyribonuclease [Limimaricola variabilis]
MPDRITIVIPGKPFGKQRPKFDPRSGRAYTPDATVSFEQTVRELAAKQLTTPLEGPISMTLEAVFVPAKSWSKKRRAAALGTLHTQKPDLDNIEKAILDGLNRIAFADDQQVADVRKRKRWGEREETIVTLEVAS